MDTNFEYALGVIIFYTMLACLTLRSEDRSSTSFETSENIYQDIRRNIPETLLDHLCENLRSEVRVCYFPNTMLFVTPQTLFVFMLIYC
jgi:hypothetical protein